MRDYINHVYKTFQFYKNLTINQEYKKLFLLPKILKRNHHFKPNKVDQDQIKRTGCLCKSCVHLSLYISRIHARYADVLD
jgi:hypothetical protein